MEDLTDAVTAGDLSLLFLNLISFRQCFVNHKISSNSRELLLLHAIKMASPEVHHLFHEAIADHAFSADHSILAIARENQVQLYGSKYELKDELKGHDKSVTSVDIAPDSGMIVTCSQGIYRSNLSSIFSVKQHILEHITLTIPPQRPQRLRLDPNLHRLYSHTRPPPPQPRRNLCAVVTIGNKIRSRQRRTLCSRLLLRDRRKLVGQQASQEANPLHHHFRRLASKLRLAGRWWNRRTCKSLQCFRQGC